MEARIVEEGSWAKWLIYGLKTAASGPESVFLLLIAAALLSLPNLLFSTLWTSSFVNVPCMVVIASLSFVAAFHNTIAKVDVSRVLLGATARFIVLSVIVFPILLIYGLVIEEIPPKSVLENVCDSILSFPAILIFLSTTSGMNYVVFYGSGTPYSEAVDRAISAGAVKNRAELTRMKSVVFWSAILVIAVNMFAKLVSPVFNVVAALVGVWIVHVVTAAFKDIFMGGLEEREATRELKTAEA